MVFAFNGIGCTASPIVVAHTPPGIVTDLKIGGPGANGSRFDFTITGGAIDGEALTGEYSLYYRFTNVDATEYGPIGFNEFLTGSGQQYGNDVGVQVRACRSYDTGPVCQSGYSGEFHLGTAVDPQISGLAECDAPSTRMRLPCVTASRTACCTPSASTGSRSSMKCGQIGKSL
jgi:hypothetical protein